MPNLISASNLSVDYINHYINFNDKYELHELAFIKPRQNEKIYTWIEDNYLFVKLVNIQHLNKIETIAFAALELIQYNGEAGYQIKIIKSFIQSRGLMTYIFKFLIFELNEIIYSDVTHTLPGSMNFWKKLKSMDNVHIECINIENGDVQTYNDQTDIEIWGIDEEMTINGEINIELLETYRETNIINQYLYDYILDNQSNIACRKNIVLKIKNVG